MQVESLTYPEIRVHLGADLGSVKFHEGFATVRNESKLHALRRFDWLGIYVPELDDLPPAPDTVEVRVETDGDATGGTEPEDSAKTEDKPDTDGQSDGAPDEIDPANGDPADPDADPADDDEGEAGDSGDGTQGIDFTKAKPTNKKRGK